MNRHLRPDDEVVTAYTSLRSRVVDLVRVQPAPLRRTSGVPVVRDRLTTGRPALRRSRTVDAARADHRGSKYQPCAVSATPRQSREVLHSARETGVGSNR